MPGKTILELLEKLDPEKALKEVSLAVKTLFPLLDQESRLNFVVSLIGDAGADKVASLVNLWLAECMDEGVDPTKMCQSLVDKVFQSKQLRTVAEPDILALFEDWLEELEEEIINQVQKTGPDDLGELARGLGLSRAGVNFLITKLKREDRI
jgi:hypothetical protein